MNSSFGRRGPLYAGSSTTVGLLEQLTTLLNLELQLSCSLPAAPLMRCCQEGRSAPPCKQHVVVSSEYTAQEVQPA